MRGKEIGLGISGGCHNVTGFIAKNVFFVAEECDIVTFVLAGQIVSQCGMDFVSETVALASLLRHLWRGVVAGQLCHTVAWSGPPLERVF